MVVNKEKKRERIEVYMFVNRAGQFLQTFILKENLPAIYCLLLQEKMQHFEEHLTKMAQNQNNTFHATIELTLALLLAVNHVEFCIS